MMWPEINIARVSNGWVVTLPVEQGGSGIFGGEIPKKTMSSMVSMIRKATKDPLLDPEEPEEKDGEDQEGDFALPRVPNVHIFLSFGEVLSFLKYKITDP